MQNIDLIPFSVAQKRPYLYSKEIKEDIEWMKKKDALNQDIMLIGSPRPLLRHIAFYFCELMNREVEYVALTRDTTESDLKQRREISESGTSLFVDQALIRCAIHGRILILEFLHLVERNVLPIINNILENREINLEDGRFLINPKREIGDNKRLVKVHPNFRVIAIGVPSPPFLGNPLDPPLRSRFNGRRVNPVKAKQFYILISKMLPNLPKNSLSKLIEMIEALNFLVDSQQGQVGIENMQIAFHHIPLISENSILSAAKMMFHFPGLDLFNEIIPVVFPWNLFVLHEETFQTLTKLFASLSEQKKERTFYIATNLTHVFQKSQKMEIQFQNMSNPNEKKNFENVSCGFLKNDQIFSSNSNEISFENKIVSAMLKSHVLKADILICGLKGSGKGFIAKSFAKILGHSIFETLFLYKDMTSRDLLQRRTTNEKGQTVWQNTPLVIAMQKGRLAILDGIDRVDIATLPILFRLIEDREITLFDGTSFISQEKYKHLEIKFGEKAEQEFKARKINCIHPSFRIVATATPPTRENPWLTHQVMHLFHFFDLSTFDTFDINENNSKIVEDRNYKHVFSIVRNYCPKISSGDIEKLVNFYNMMHRASKDVSSSISNPISLRALLRASKHFETYGNMHSTLSRSIMLHYMPPISRDFLISEISKIGIIPEENEYLVEMKEITQDKNILRIGSVECEMRVPVELALVPQIIFYNIPKHTQVLECMLKDFLLGEHLLLIGNQGVGKNKLCDRFLELLRIEREYIQLHRDTTVSNLTISPSLENGKVRYEDSPLVKAMINGRVLVIDESDKAPTEVVFILKGLLDDGEIELADGRKFVTEKSSVFKLEKIPKRYFRVNPNFRIIALANRPGFPFLGQNLFAELGDVFSCHIIDNPPQHSEIVLLQSYAPNVPVSIIKRITSAFAELRNLSDEGMLAYPYSIRECVAVVKHLEKYPNDNIATVLDNIFSFDSFDLELQKLLFEIFLRHGIPINSKLLKNITLNSSLAKENSNDFSVIMAFFLQLPRPCTSFNSQFSSFETLSSFNAPSHLKPVKFNTDLENVVLDHFTQHTTKFSEEKRSFFIQQNFHTGIPVDLKTFPDQNKNNILVLTIQPFEIYCYELSEPQIPTFRTHLTSKIVNFCHTEFFDISSTFFDNFLLILVSQFSAMVVFDLQNFCVVDVLNIPIFSFKNEFFDTKEKLIFANPNFHHSKSVIILTQNGNKIGILNFENGKFQFKISVIPAEFSILNASILEPNDLILTVFDKQFKNSFSYITKISDLKNPKISFYLAENIFTEEGNKFKKNSNFEDQNFIFSTRKNLNSISKSSQQEISHIFVPKESDKIIASIFYGFFPPKSKIYYDQIAEIFFILDKNKKVEKKTQHAIFMQKISCLVVVTHFEKEIEILVLDFKEKEILSKKILVAEKYNNKSNIKNETFRSHKNSQNKKFGEAKFELPKIVKLAETKVGTLMILFEDSTLREFELEKEILKNEEKEWMKMIGQNSKDENSDSGAVGSGGEGGEGEGGSGSKGENGESGSGNNAGILENTDFNLETENFTSKKLTEKEEKELEKDAEKILAQALNKAKNATAKNITGKNQTVGLQISHYEKLYNVVSNEINSLRKVLEFASANEKARVWMKNQIQGELDDNKLIDASVGEKNIFKKRGQEDPLFGNPILIPKRIIFVIDVSSSMARMNGSDRRLDRMAATVVMIMEAFHGFGHKFDYSIVGQDGESPKIEFINFGKAPKTQNERLSIIDKIYWNASFTQTGDNTLASATLAVDSVVSETGDDYFVFLLSDANLSSYGINSSNLKKVLFRNPKVKCFAFFLAGGREAAKLVDELPNGHSFLIMDTSKLPNIFKNIFQQYFNSSL